MIIASQRDQESLRFGCGRLRHRSRLASIRCRSGARGTPYAQPVYSAASHGGVQRVVEMRSVGVRRGSQWLLAQLDWEVLTGSRWVVLGPNGAGKTTLLTMAAAQLFPTRGDVEILGEQLGMVDLGQLRTRIGWTSALLASELPVGETVANVVLTGAHAVTGRWREEYDEVDFRRASWLVGEWGLADVAQRSFGTLSEGERKRCLIARSLMADPELLVLDEPAAGLDLAGREQLIHSLGRLAKDPSSPTIVLVTHHVEEIPPGFTDVLLLRAGSVSAVGPLDQTLTDDNLTRTFGIDIRLHRAQGRFFAMQAGT